MKRIGNSKAILVAAALALLMAAPLSAQSERGPQGVPGPAGPQGLSGLDLPAGGVITLKEGVAPPAGYSLIGTTLVVVRKPNGQVSTIALSLFQKN